MLATIRKLHPACARALALATVLFSASCGGSPDRKPPDPAGTVTTSINTTVNATPIELYYGLAEDGPYVRGSTTYPYVSINFGMNLSPNFAFHTGVSTTPGTYSNAQGWFGLGTFGGEVADVGPVAGLGEVTEKPAAGWSAAAAVQAGHGYVARYRRSPSYATATTPYVYVRIYVEDWVQQPVIGGIIGARLRYQTPF